MASVGPLRSLATSKNDHSVIPPAVKTPDSNFAGIKMPEAKMPVVNMSAVKMPT